MTTLEDILSRRSIRRYTGEDLSEEVVTQLLEAAMAAPSAGNEQPWHFVVIRDRGKLEAMPKDVSPHTAMCREAALAIAICGTPDVKHGEMWVQDCAAATENMLLAAHALRLGAVWCGIYPRADRMKALKDMLGLPEDVEPFCLVPVGWPAESKDPAGRYDLSRIHHDAW